MRRDVLEYACNVLDQQYANIAKSSTKQQALKQQAFYQGCKMMFEIIYTQGYTDIDKTLYLDKYGIHRINS